MFRNRVGTPRSATSRAGLTRAATPAVRRAERANSGRPAISAASANIDDAPATPPAKKYHGNSGFQTGGLTIGRP
jgi:hypothetical protein